MTVKRWIVAAGLLPLLLLLLGIRWELNTARNLDNDRRDLETRSNSGINGAGPTVNAATQAGRVVFILVDSMLFETAWDSGHMPWLNSFRAQSVHGRMTPCLAQLSLSCIRTQFEGREPLLATGLLNFSGERSDAPSILRGLFKNKAYIAMVSDRCLINQYRPFLTKSASFEDNLEAKNNRDNFSLKTTLQWLREPDIDFIFTLLNETDIYAHRYHPGSEQYRLKFNETDAKCRTVYEHLQPGDTLIIAGDHGHDKLGHHSTGIEAETAYFISGPAFRAGIRQDINMCDMYFFLSAATRQEPAPDYCGNRFFELLEPSLAGAASVTDSHKSASTNIESSPGTSKWTLLFLLLITYFLYFLAAMAAPNRKPTVRLKAIIAFNMVTLLTGIFTEPIYAMAAAGAVNLIYLLYYMKDFAPHKRLLSGFTACLILTGFLAAWAPMLLVVLQSYGNHTWTVSFIGVVVLIALLVSFPISRFQGIDYRTGTGFTLWTIVFFLLFLGPYYYGTARWLLLALHWLLIVAGWSRFKTNPILIRWSALTIAPAIPIYFPVMKEWSLRYVLTDFTEPFPMTLFSALIGGVATIYILAAPDKKGGLKMLVPAAAHILLGTITELPKPTLLASVLLFFSYSAWSGFCLSLKQTGPVPGFTALLPGIGGVSYSFMLFFVLFRAFRFSNVEFNFVFKYLPMEWSEGLIAAVATPMVIIKYCVPVALLLALGRRLQRNVLVLLQFKLIAMSLFYVVMVMNESTHRQLFNVFLGQEIILLSFLWATIIFCFAAFPDKKTAQAQALAPETALSGLHLPGSRL